MTKVTIEHHDPKAAPCSNCGKPKHETNHLIAWVDKRGVDIYICDECVDLCRAILDQQMKERARAFFEKLLALSEKVFAAEPALWAELQKVNSRRMSGDSLPPR